MAGNSVRKCREPRKLNGQPASLDGDRKTPCVLVQFTAITALFPTVGRDDLRLAQDFFLELGCCGNRGRPLIDWEMICLNREECKVVVMELVSRWARATIAGLSVIIFQLYGSWRRQPFIEVPSSRRQNMG